MENPVTVYTHDIESPAPAEDAIVQEETRLLQVVQTALERTFEKKEERSYDRQLMALRDALSEEKLNDDQAAILEQMDRISALSLARAKHVQGRLDPLNPYFAHMRIDYDEGGRRDILIGKETFVSDGIRVVDWRNAPISRVFYQTRQGESFDVDIADREVSGDMVARRTVTIRNGALQRITSPEGTFLLSEGSWEHLTNATKTLEGGQGTASRPDTMAPMLGARSTGERLIRDDKHLTEIAALLDPEQFGLITGKEAGLVAIQGSAGSGKTTVGLHRLAFLTFDNKARYRPHRMLVLVFSESLARYISHVLPALGVKGVPVRTLHHWALEQVQFQFTKLPKRRSDETPASVVRFKTHTGLLKMLEDGVATMKDWKTPDIFDELFTDIKWIEKGLRRYAKGEFSATQVKQIHRWCADQYGVRDDLAFAKESGEKPESNKAAYDYEDDMLLLRIEQLRSGGLKHRSKRPLVYDHILVDEAQDFSPLELLVLKDCAREGSITLAGDTAQVVNEAHSFSDWTDALEAIGEEHINISPLAISYRSTRQIMEIAHHVLGPLAPAEMASAPRDGAPVELLSFGGQGEALTYIADALGDLVDREPRAGIAVLTRYPHQADEAYGLLTKADLPSLHRVRSHDFAFTAGIEVSDIAQTKGLEFDYVIILAADEETFPNDMNSSRHLLHVGMTRGAHQVWLVSWRNPTKLLPNSLIKRDFG